MKLNRQFDSYTFFGSLDWNHVWERQQELISRFAKIIEGKIYNFKPLGVVNYTPISLKFFKKILQRKADRYSAENPRQDNLETVAGFTIPFHNSLFGKINYWLLKRRFNFSKDNNFFWATYPNYTIYEFFKRSKFRVYDIAERRSQNPIVPKYAKKIERKMVAQADIVFIDNHAAIEDYKELNNNIYYIPQGVNVETFAKDQSVEKEYIGYIGNFHFAIDYALLKDLILKNSDKKFLLVGAILENEANEIMALPNVTHIDKVPKTELSIYMAKMKLGIIPYLINDVTVGVYPTKMFEYIAAGVPVISTPLPEVVQYADDDYMKIITEAVELNFAFAMSKCNELLEQNSWDARWDLYIEKLNERQNN